MGLYVLRKYARFSRVKFLPKKKRSKCIPIPCEIQNNVLHFEVKGPQPGDVVHYMIEYDDINPPKARVCLMRK